MAQEHPPRMPDRIDPALLPLLPLIYVAWADCTLTMSEMQVISEIVAKQGWLGADVQRVIRAWLDPQSPPTARELQHLLGTIRRLARRLPSARRRSLAELGIELARQGAEDLGDWETEEAQHALAEIERAMGVIGTEASQELVAAAPERVVPPEEPRRFDVAGLTGVLDGEYGEARQAVRSLLGKASFRYAYGLDKATYRERVLEWCRTLAGHSLGATAYPAAYGGRDDLGSFIATFEQLAFFDLSLVVKFGVQFGLFGGSIHQLGTRDHHDRYLHAAGTLDLPGCFAMTETGHGSNVRDVETVARFDIGSDEFVIHTPTDEARKDYIGNAALHGRLATVFAQLEIDEEHHGVHAFVVPIRSEDGDQLPGVRIEDCGEKLGLNGVDNGRIWFDHVRIPRENLLNRFADVSPGGEYHSPIADPSRRFFTMLGSLVGGRISVAAAALSAAKSGLAIAIRYGAERRQFGRAGEPEQVILDYLTHQRRLMPRLAAAYALDFAVKYLVRRFLDRTDEDAREVEALAAGIKAISTWQTIDTLQTCREACGGQGYLTVNRFAHLKADTDVFTTFEGDNTVLLQLVAKGLLTEYRHQFGELKFFGVLKFLARRTATTVTELNPIITRLTDEDHLRGPDFQLGAFTYREQRLLASAAQRLKRLFDDGHDSLSAFNSCQDHLVALARAHAERVIVEQFLIASAANQDKSFGPILKSLADLYALWRIEHDRGWFLESGYLASNKAKAIRGLVNQLCGEVRTDAVALVDAFGIPNTCLGAPIARS
jgi:acyl-CoA oxidase